MLQSAIAKISEYLTNLRNQVDNLELQLLSLKQQSGVKKSDPRLTEIRQEIKTLKGRIADGQRMPDFAVNSYCQNQHSEIGKVTEIKEESGNLQAVVEFENGTNGTYSPHNLTLVAKEDLDFIWLGEPRPKLFRKIDRKECDQFSVLNREEAIARAELDRAISFGQPDLIKQPHQDKINYCVARTKALKLKNPEQLEPTEYDQLELVSQALAQSESIEKLQKIAIANIERHPDCQQRGTTRPDIVENYLEVLQSGSTLPAPKVKFDGQKYWLFDGFHTVETYIQFGSTEILFQVEEGSFRDAVLASCGVNANHGLPRSNKTKRNAVMRLLNDKEWGQWSDREIAKRCEVSNVFVSGLRKNLTVNINSDNPRKYNDKYGNQSEMNVANIGANSQEQEQEPTPPNQTEEVNQTTQDLQLVEQKPELPTERTEPPETPESNLEFLPNQLLLIDLADRDHCGEELKAINHKYCFAITKAATGQNYKVKVYGGSKDCYLVKTEDLRPVSQATITLTYEPAEYMAFMSLYGSQDNLIDELKQTTGGKAIAAK